MPPALPELLQAVEQGTGALLARPAIREALEQIRASLFQIQGRDLEARAAWQESLACAIFAAGVARLRSASVSTVVCAGLLHRAGETLALKILARVELEYRMKLDGPARREWCATNSHELQERLTRAWPLPAAIGACLLGWNRFGEFTEVSPEGAAVYFGRLFAIELSAARHLCTWCHRSGRAESGTRIGEPCAAGT